MRASRAVACFVLTCTVGGGPVAGQAQTPVASPPPAQPSAAASALASDTATISNTGSTNTSAFTITVDRNGKATVSVGGSTPVAATVPKKLVDKLFADLAATPSLQSINVRGCMKSASFGTSTLLSYGGHVSPDLSCAADPHGQTLYSDVKAIQGALPAGDLKTTPRNVK